MSRRKHGLLVGALILAVSSVAPGPVAAQSVAGSAGTDASLPMTDSAVTVSGRGRFSSLQVTLNQTRDLVNQAVSVTWVGGDPTRRGPGEYAANYLQVMQCWGEPDATVPENPGPPPEQCVFGAANAVHGGRVSHLFPPGSFATERIVARVDWPGYDEADGSLDTRTGFQWKPFRSVRGDTVDVHYDPTFNPAIVGGNYWLNTSFNVVTTNEVVAARTGSNGQGAELFEVVTGLESDGLGCGQRVEAVAGGEPRVPRCWMVIVPRGTPAGENVGHHADQAVARPDAFGVQTSPLSDAAWANRIAIPLEFVPIDTPCSLAADQRRIVGSELLVPAVSSWQRALCAAPDLPPYSYASVGDATARQQILSGAPGAPGMAVMSRPFDPSLSVAEDPIVYAPVGISALVIGMNVERVPNPNRAGPEGEALKGVRVSTVNLTPRLVAKLLTQSYKSQLAIKVPPAYEWMASNPDDLAKDPDFLQFNPEFAILDNGGKNLGGLVMPGGTSDSALRVWEWIFADPEAKAWLDGGPDEWGMNVNPWYATSASASASGIAFGDPIPDSLPKSDPYCYQAPPQGARAVVPPALCATEWLPYAQGLADSARRARSADDAARTTDNPFVEAADQFYRRNEPQLPGSRTILSLTDSPSAALYGLQVARLSRAGDNGGDRNFIGPDESSMGAGFQAMTPRAEPAVVEPDHLSPGSQNAYPLTIVTYAAARPLALDPEAREQYASFLDYAAGDGQIPGRNVGQLVPGYAPLPESLRAQATAAAVAIREFQPPGPAALPAAVPDTGGPRAAAARPSGASTATAPTPTVTATPESPDSLAASAAVLSAAPVAPAPTILRTPAVGVSASRFLVPGLLGVAILSALGALEITKRPRYRAPGPGEANRPTDD